MGFLQARCALLDLIQLYHHYVRAQINVNFCTDVEDPATYSLS